MVDKAFFEYLKSQLYQVMGPVAEVMIEDEIREMGETPGNISIDRAPDLIIFLSRYIPREEKRILFLKAMAKKLRAE